VVADGDDELIAAPLGRVHIAGEHTAGAWSGLMEGALRSGARAASEVLTAAYRT
jgi:monoamine oxidase